MKRIIICFVLIAILFFSLNPQPVQAGFFGWVKSLFVEEQPEQEVLPSSNIVNEVEQETPMITPLKEEEETANEVEIDKEIPECPKCTTNESLACEPKIITREVPVEKIVYKEIPVEKVVIKEVPKEIVKEVEKAREIEFCSKEDTFKEYLNLDLEEWAYWNQFIGMQSDWIEAVKLGDVSRGYEIIGQERAISEEIMKITNKKTNLVGKLGY